jgi:hypothetical protein
MEKDDCRLTTVWTPQKKQSVMEKALSGSHLYSHHHGKHN